MAATNDKNPFHLSTAASNGHTDLVELLLDEDGIQLDEKDDRDRTPLFLAASNGHAEVVELLLEHATGPAPKVNVNQQSKDTSTPLKAALTNDHAGVAEILLRLEHIDVNIVYLEEWTPLGAASGSGHLKVVKTLVKRLGGSDKLYENHRGENAQGTPLYLASDAGHTKVVKLLLKPENLLQGEKKKEYIDQTSMGGRTALLAAATNGHADVVALLLDNDADTEKQSSDGMTPLKAAIINGHANVVKLLYDKVKLLYDKNRGTGNAAGGTGNAAGGTGNDDNNTGSG
ncbi:hypothetical protein DL771_003147 [Monosporascus sp. 5C6A]|nr:hypothetical protein DL771_003147 [Monosporascus sp. 5C6A]